MLTGDGKTTAEAVGRELGIDEVIADVLPEDKASVVQRLKAEGRVVAMAGDGVNDAPALAAADVGIAMGTGTDVAMESSGVTLLKGDLMGIVRARQLSQATMRNIRQNLFFSFCLQRRRHPGRGGRALPVLWLAAVAGHGGGGDGAVLGERHRQCAEAAGGAHRGGRVTRPRTASGWSLIACGVWLVAGLLRAVLLDAFGAPGSIS